MKYENELKEYLAGIEFLKNKIKELPFESLNHKPAPGKWNITEIIVHLTDAEMNAALRMRKIIAESGASIIPYDQDRWASELNYQSQNVDQAVGLFALIRDVNYKILINLKDGVWDNFVMHPESGKINLKRWLDIYNEHLKKHFTQMENCFNDWEQKK